MRKQEMCALLVPLLATLGLASGQQTTSTSDAWLAYASAAVTAYNTSIPEPLVHVVSVGKGGNQFEPNTTVANVGDVIAFQFFPANHSVVRAEFKFPCIPYDTMNPGAASFFSGFMPVADVLNNPPTFNVRINDTQPVFFYCSAPGSCLDNDMVGVVNPNGTQTLAEQASLIGEDGIMLQPGEPFPAESSSSVVSIASSTATFTPIVSVTAVPSSTATASTPTPGHARVPTGAIAGAAVGGVVVLTLAGTLIWYMSRSRTLKQTLEGRSKSASMPNVSQSQRDFVGGDDFGKWAVSPSAPPSYTIPQSPEQNTAEHKDDTHTYELVGEQVAHEIG